MAYQVKELFYSLQGEGANAGRAAVFCRFAGCNLWSGREADREGAACDFCDTDFVGTDGSGGGTYPSAEALADAALALWPEAAGEGERFVVLTGGEPALQADRALIEALRNYRFEVAIETNGTRTLPDGFQWVCVSPKGRGEPAVREGDELKLVYPQRGVDPEAFAGLPFDHFFLQPKDGPDIEQNTRLALNYCRRHPQWRLSLQLHKTLGIR